MRAIHVVLVVMCSLVPAPGGQLQAQAETTDSPLRRFSFSGTFGFLAITHAGGLADQIRDLGYDDTMPYGCFIFCSGPTEYPRTHRGPSLSLSARYELDKRWAVSAGVGWSELREAVGWTESGPIAGLGEYLTSRRWTDRTVWAVGHVKPAWALSVGAGVAKHDLRSGFDDDPGRVSTSRIGVVLEATIRLPRESRLFWETKVRGHYVPEGFQERHDEPWREPIVLNGNWSHVSLETGVGIRLW